MERVCTWQPSVPQSQGHPGLHSLDCRRWTGAFGVQGTPFVDAMYKWQDSIPGRWMVAQWCNLCLEGSPRRLVGPLCLCHPDLGSHCSG